MTEINWDLIKEYSECENPFFYFRDKDVTRYIQELGKAVMYLKKKDDLWDEL